MRGRYVVLEGGERVGKTTQSEVLVGTLRHRGFSVQFIREPGGTKEGEVLRELVKDNRLKYVPMVQAHLHNAARIQMLDNVVHPLLERGVWVVSDRCYLSTIVYQGHAQGLLIGDMRILTSLATRTLEPDLIIVLDGLPERMQLRRDDTGSDDRYDNESVRFHHLIRDGYLYEAREFGHPLINADDDEGAVTNQIWRIVAGQFEEVR